MALGRSRLDIPKQTAKALRWPLRLTHAGMIAERITRAFWPFASILLLVLAALMFGLHDTLSLEVFWALVVFAALAVLGSLVFAVRKFRWPSGREAVERLDESLPARPIAAITDTQAIGASDAASQQVWRAHLARMAAQAAEAKAVEPNISLARRDPFGLRYVSILAFVMALVFGSILRITTVADVAQNQTAAATGPVWEGWIEPPNYTGKPSLYLADLGDDTVSVPIGSQLTLRIYGEVGALTVAETVSGRVEVASAADALQEFQINQSGRLSIEGDGGQSWDILVIKDQAPEILMDGEPERGVSGEMRLPFSAKDDYAVAFAQAELTLNLDEVDRRFGLAIEPEARAPIVLDLPLPISGDRSDFSEVLVENLAEHAWATLPVSVKLTATDAGNQSGVLTGETITLPGRRFFDPVANALIEQRRDLLWNRENGARVSQILRAISYRAEDVFRSETGYLKLRFAIRRLEEGFAEATLSTEQRDEIAQVLWDIATLIEDGNLSDALERLRRAQERLSEAMKQGASDEEIAELMDELRDAMDEYMRQLAQQQQNQNQQAENQETQEITEDQLQQMLERIQELMEQGRNEEAQELLDQLQRMMENMQITQGEQGEGQNGPGQQAMEGLADTLRQQQGLSDETFGDSQEQGDEGGQGPEGEQGQQQGNGQGDQGGQGEGGPNGQGLAQRQQALRDMLDDQIGNLPGGGTPGDDSTSDALGRAGRAMEGAEEALRDNDFAEALDNQAEAMEALREGMRSLAEEMAQQQQNQQGQQGEAFGQSDSENSRDPLGREAGANGRIGTDEQLLQGDDVYRRARELLDEIRKRSSEQDRPDVELDYLKRLLDRF